MRKLSRKLPTCVLLLVGVTGVVASSCKNNTISSNYNGSSNEAGPVDTTATTATTSSPSATGTASTPPSRCTPGTKRCPGGATGPVLETCAQDGAWVAENCPSAFPLCKLDKCVEECVPNATRCDGDSTQKCQSDRTWGAATPCPASDPICSAAGTCGKTCGDAGDKRCIGDTIETCDGVRTWGSPLACSGATPKCLNGSPPRCGIIDCTPPGESGCLGTTRRTCNADSTWAAGSPCSGATPACLETPGAPKSAACVECSSGSGCLDARTPKTCVGGAWTPSAACNVGSECKPATSTCGACAAVSPGNAWENLLPAGGPPPGRNNAAMAYDPSDHSMILFGGHPHVSISTTGLNDTWRLAGAQWTRLNPATSPSPRELHAMATNTANGKVYMFGGQAGLGGARNNELWEWNGSTWTQRCKTAPCSANAPTPRNNPGFAYDSDRDRLVVLGGTETGGGGANDMWEWDGSAAAGVGAWTLVCGRAGPACGNAAGTYLYNNMTYAAGWKRMVYLYRDQTYQYSGAPPWALQGTNATPPWVGIEPEGMVYDPVRKVVVAMGHTAPPPSLDIRFWEWNGACWSDTTPGGGVPHGGNMQTLAYDPEHNRVVRFGGETPAGTYNTSVFVRSSL